MCGRWSSGGVSTRHGQVQVLFSAQGADCWTLVNTLANSALWMTLAAAKAGGGADKVTKDSFVSYVKATTKDHVVLGTPLNCKGAVAPYVSVCSPFQRVRQWDGAKYVTKKVNLDATYIVKGTPIDFGKWSDA